MGRMTSCNILIFLLLQLTAVDALWSSSCSKRNCKLSNWGPWGDCTTSCGRLGTKSRKRRIILEPSCKGKVCGLLFDTKECNQKCCPVDCVISWGAWGVCTGCGTNGQQESLPSVGKQEQCGGVCNLPPSRKKSCDTGICCPVNCQVGRWSSWGSCNAQCEKQGTQSRKRSITKQASCNGKSCDATSQRRPCVGGCCPRDCVFSQWSGWSECTAPTGVCSVDGGTKTRTRSLLKPAVCGGKCDVKQQTQKCTVQSIQCQLSSWSGWASCKPTNGKCGSGSRKRTRTVRVQPVCSRACDTLTATSQCMHSCCPVNCVYNNWGTWSQCTNQCGKGMQTRTRTIKSQAKCNGVTCQQKQLTQTKTCSQYINVDCVLSGWSSWSVCDNGCGTGKSVSTRKVSTPNKCQGKVCGSLIKQQACQSYRDRTDCQVSQWSSYGPCTEKCAQGVRYRNRNITTQTVCGGKVCPLATVNSNNILTCIICDAPRE